MAIAIATIIAYLKVNHEGARYIDWSLPITVCRSGAGYYIGMWDDGPVARFSCEYYPTQELAQEALDNGTFSARLWL